MLNPVLDQGGGALPLDRARIERIIDNLLALLDASEPDPDLEEPGDDEPYLGWPTNAAGAHSSAVDDREWDDSEHGIADRDGLMEQWPSHYGEMAI
jgi:hypothetical protein